MDGAQTLFSKDTVRAPGPRTGSAGRRRDRPEMDGLCCAGLSNDGAISNNGEI